MPAAQEFERLRKAQVSLNNRKNGLHDIPLVTVARADILNRWSDIIHSLPHAETVRLQNDDGSFPYLPGWDGPILP
jgi:hypothetical protein